MVAVRDTSGLGDDLDRLACAVEALEFGPRLSDLERESARLASVMRSYLMPRAQDSSTPLTVVVAGPTGSGKSTLVNSLTGFDMSAAGPLRPTTRVPVVLAGESSAANWDSIAGVDCQVVKGQAPILKSIVLVDTPDIDSTVATHREVAETLIDNADVVIFVTSVLRYADAVPWQILRRAVARGTEVIQVLNRVSSSTSGAATDFMARLRDAGLDDDLITIPEHHLPGGAQRVPSLAVRAVRGHLADIALSHDGAVERAFDRVLRSTIRQVEDLNRSIVAALDEVDDYEAEISLDLAERFAELDLVSVGSGLMPPLADSSAPRDARRWLKVGRRRQRLSDDDFAAIVARLETVVERDLRRWLAGRPVDESDFVAPGEIIPAVMPILRLGMEGWITFVRRIAEDESGLGRGFVELVLVAAALSNDLPPEADLLFGDDAAVMVSRAQRELIGRLDVVYGEVVSHLVERRRSQIGEPDLSDVRAAVGALRSTLAPVHA